MAGRSASLLPLWAILVFAVGVARAQPTTAPAPPEPDAATHPADAVPIEPATQPIPTQPVPTQPATAPVKTPAIPLGEINEKADPDTAIARGIEAESAGDRLIAEIAADLPALLSEIDARSGESQRQLAGAPSLADLRSLESDWLALQETLDEWKDGLTQRAKKLDADVGRLDGMYHGYWLPTLASITATNEPPELIQQTQAVVDAVRLSKEAVEKRRSTVLSLQSRVREASVRVGSALATVRTQQDAALNRLLVRDSPPIWDISDSRAVGAESQQSIVVQWTALKAYMSRKPLRGALHAGLWIVLLPILFGIRRWARRWAKEDPTVRRSELAFETPLATATILALLLSGWLYPHAPRLLWAIIVALALFPTIIVVRRLLEKRLLPILYALGVFFTIDRFRAVALSQPRAYQLLLVVEMAAGAALLIWFVRSGRLRAAVDYSDFVESLIVITCRIFTVLFLVATLAGALGYVALGTLLGDAALGSAYLAVILYAATRILEGLVMVALRIRPVALLQAVSKNRRLVWLRICRAVNWAALIVWVLGTLEMLSVRQIVVDAVVAATTASLTIGAFSLSLWQLIAFGLTVWASLLLSRFILFILQEDVYPRLHMARGLPYAVSTVLHYLILLIGFTIAVQMLGYDMTKFTILAGAFGVGLGFGLQNIFNNFVSGLILLFERPIKVGDVIQVGPDTGTVRRIGIRASVIRLGTGAEVIMPNGKLISDPVTNWTLSGRGRDIAMEIAVAGSTEPRQVIALWSKVTAVHPKIAEEPPPRAVLMSLGADTLKFELRAWTSEFESWSSTRSDLAIAIHAALTDAGIAVK